MSLHTLKDPFATMIEDIVHILDTDDNAEHTLAGLKAEAQCKILKRLMPNPPSEADVNNALTIQHLFSLLRIGKNTVDISLLEMMMTALQKKNAAKILEEYKECHIKTIHKAVAHLVDTSTDGTCPRPYANSCILQLVFSDEKKGMLVEEVLAWKQFLFLRFGIQPEDIEYISAITGNGLVVTWLASRDTGLKVINQCMSVPVRAALREKEVPTVRLWYLGQLRIVETT